MNSLYILFLAAVPPLIMAAIFHVMDKNREPQRALWRAFLVGLGSIGMLEVLRHLLQLPRLTSTGDLRGAFVTAFANAAFQEEMAKWIVFAGLLHTFDEIDEWYDGILYGVIVGLGFAFAENVGYYTVYGISLDLFVARTAYAMSLHAFMGGIMGYFLVQGRLLPHKGPWWVFYGLAFAFPFLIHGSYNFLAMYEGFDLSPFLVPIVAGLWFLLLRLRRQTQNKLAAML
jgi:RsiW-degrading membrane proteinase PrsW (M82 family)